MKGMAGRTMLVLLCCALLQEPNTAFVPAPQQHVWTCRRVSRISTWACCGRSDTECRPHRPDTPATMPRRDFLSSSSAAAAIGCCVFGGSPPLPASAAAGVSTPRLLTAGDPAIPHSSTRRYKRIVLANGMRVLLVQDLRVRQAAAALSVGGAGQWADPDDLPGLAHLCEHMALSYEPVGSQRFEDWLADRAEGSSNAFTAYDNVCFHFTCPDKFFQEGLERFSGLFIPSIFASVCRNPRTLQREIRRVSSEIDPDDTNLQASSLSKAFVNPDHPYSRFSMGSAETLEFRPKAAGTDIAERLIHFFRTRYQASEAVLVVTSPQNLTTLEQWVMPFAATLSPDGVSNTPLQPRCYPGGFSKGSRAKQMVLFRDANSDPDEDSERLFMEWILNLDYTEAIRDGQPVVMASQIAFLVSQVLGRRGPGSLFAFLARRGWVKATNAALPRVTLPVQASGFQVLKLELALTREGFLHRSEVLAAVFDSLQTLRVGPDFGVAHELVTQWASMAKLHAYLWSLRPPDAIELAQDAHLYGMNGLNGVGSGRWYRFPEADDVAAIAALRKSLASTLAMMVDPTNAVVIATASRKAIDQANLPPLIFSRRWQSEPWTGGRFLFDDMLGQAAHTAQRAAVDREELLRPSLNALVPVLLKPPRPGSLAANSRRANDGKTSPPTARESKASSGDAALRERALDRSAWTLLDPTGDARIDTALLPSPPNYRAALVLQLLSARPASASLRQAAQGELWKVSWASAVGELAEQGTAGGLAYDVSFNEYGMRVAFLGIRQNLPAYARLLCRSLLQHHARLRAGPEAFPARVTAAAAEEARRTRGMSGRRTSQLASSLRQTTAYDAAAEGEAFLRSCSGAVCFAQGDWASSGDVAALQRELEAEFAPYTSAGPASVSGAPRVYELVYKPVWKPRGVATPCSVAGIQLISDTCGRVPR